MRSGILVITFLFSVNSFAQGPATLTFREAVRIGLENNVTLNQQKNQLEYTQINKTSSMLRLGPSIQGDASAYRVDGNSFNQNAGEVINGQIDYVNGSISASMPVFNGMRQVSLYKQANFQNEAQLHQVNRSNQDVIRDVANQYLTCLLDVQLIKIDEENVAAQQLQYDQIKEQVNLGARAEADLYNQEYQLKNAELLLLRSRNTLKNDKAILAQTIQIDPAVPFELEEINWDVNAVIADTLTLDQMYETAMQRRSDLKQAENTEKAAHFGFNSFKGRYYPSISAGASFGSRYNYIHGEDNRSFSDQFTQDNRQFSYGLSLTIPIYNGLLYRAQAAQSRATYENAKVLYKGTEVTVKTDVIRAYQNFRDAVTNYSASEAQLKAAELSYQMEKERYDLGISNIVQLAVVNQTFIRAKSDYQNSLFVLMVQRIRINYALGTLKFEDIP
ncbi:MAG TPA: TolC family protein [Cyclobacteriaceae bacterium]|nr:TolC family protein [Cyclobacteriaceae bacterium]